MDTDQAQSHGANQQRTMLQQLKGWGLLLVIFVFVPLAGLSFLWKDACVTSRQLELGSPDGKFVASLYATDCKGRLKPAMEVRVATRLESHDLSVPQQILLYQSDTAPTLNWAANDNLKVIYPKGVEVVTRKTDYPGLSIELLEPNY